MRPITAWRPSRPRACLRNKDPQPVYADPADGLAVPAHLLRAWTARLLAAIGTPDDIASDVADVLVAADRRGIASHGTARLPERRRARDRVYLDDPATLM